MLPSSGASGIRRLQAKLSSRTAFVFIGLRQEAGIHLDPGLLPIVENPSPTEALFLSVGSGATTLFPSADYWHHEVIPIGARSGPRNCSHRRSITNKNTPIRPLSWGCPSFPVLRQVEESLGPWQLEVRQPCMSCRSPVCRGAAQFVFAPAFPSGSPAFPLGSPRFLSASPAFPSGSPRFLLDSPAFPLGSPVFLSASPAFPSGSPRFLLDSPCSLGLSRSHIGSIPLVPQRGERARCAPRSAR